ncbi:MAG: carboxypeptidase-like regulatory domain-containing protein [Bacteroidota bacterium]
MKTLNAFLLLIFIISVPLVSEAQRFNITGRVSDTDTMQPAVQISVQDRMSGTGTITSEQGNYSLLLNHGPVELLFSGNHYEPYLVSFELKRDTLIDVRLTQVIQDPRNKRTRREGGFAFIGPVRGKEQSEK